MLRDYYELAKPGIIYGNLITLAGGFFFGAAGGWPAELGLLVATVVGLSLVVASGSAFNNYIDRDIDAVMARTRSRALVTGRISGRAALVYAAALGACGFAILFAFTNWIAAGTAALGFFFYVVMYTLWSKRRSVFGTLVGSLSGAVPPVVGYAAASGRLDWGAAMLFLIMVLWQMPHFFAIGIYRRGEYAAAGIPILPVAYGVRAAKWAMLIFIILFAAAALSFVSVVAGAMGAAYLTVAVTASAAWLAFGVKGFWARDDARWARGMFIVSLAVVTVLFVAIGVM